MNLLSILAPILAALGTISGLGILFGIGLTVASRFFHVEKDERLEKIEQILPQINCGACGFAGCAAYAGAIVGGDAALTLCTPGGEETARKLAEIMGRAMESTGAVRRVTQVHCRGGREQAVYTFDYHGLNECAALFMLGGGNKQCKYGCLGLGSCVRVCPVDAIAYDDNGLVWVDKEKCIACGKCIDVCPTKVMRWVPKDADFLVVCNSHDTGPVTKRACKVGCIACKICEKRSPEGGYQVVDYLSVIDYNAEGEREEAAKKCPTACIIPNRSPSAESFG